MVLHASGVHAQYRCVPVRDPARQPELSAARSIEAAAALGLSRPVRFFKVTLPQSMVVAIGPLGNELILIIKASAIASLVTVYDVMGIAKLAFSRSFDFQVYLWAAVLYLLVVETLRRVFAVLERRLNRHLQSRH